MRITLLFALAITGLCAETPSEELYQAIRANDLARLESLIKDPANVNVKDRHGLAPRRASPEVMTVVNPEPATCRAERQGGVKPAVGDGKMQRRILFRAQGA